MKRPLCRCIFAIIFLVAGYVTQFGGRTAAADLTPDAGDGLQPLITTSELVVGENRFAFGLLKAGKLLEGADVKLRLMTSTVEKPNWRPSSRFLTKPSKTLSSSVRCTAMRMEQHMYTGAIQVFGASTLRS